MKKTVCKLSIALAMFIAFGNQASAQDEPANAKLCRSSEMMAEYLLHHPEARQEQADNEKFTQQFIANLQNAQQKSTAGGSKYVIPCVFHVYGTTQGGKTVSLATIQSALANWVNKDFKGLNADFASVHSKFLAIRDTLSIEFALAKKDPNGNPTTGVIFYNTKSGYGNEGTYDTQIQADAWNNYSYFNIYIMNDLYADGTTGNSGVCWYPSTAMSDKNLARCVYNGVYLAGNTSQEFASVLTHEFGHFLNLIHTFEGGCGTANDNVDDTPTCSYPGHDCHTSSTANGPLNCNNALINAENYMDYSGAYGCYKMFTKWQVSRMKAALEMPSRVTLWQNSNLIKTGLLTPMGMRETETTAIRAVAYPNPTPGIFTLDVVNDQQTNYNLAITNVLGNVILTKRINAADAFQTSLDLSAHAPGVYFLIIDSAGAQKVMKLIKE